MRLFRLLPYLTTIRRVSRGRERLFDPAYYLATNPDVAASRVPALLHFLLFGGFERRKPNPLFDPEFYLRRYSDVADAEVNPLLHYLRHGHREGRKPHCLFGDQSLADFLRALRQPAGQVLYEWWMRQEATMRPAPSVRQRFSVLLALRNPRRDWLEEALGSVRTQSYPLWELSISNATGNDQWLADYLATHGHPRFRVTSAGLESSLSAALNEAANLATGDYILVLEESHRLAPDALAWLATKAPADVIYSDEDQISATGDRANPLFKPDWSPDLLLSTMYFGRIMAISRAAWDRAGGFRAEHEPVRDHDLALRVTEQARKIAHVPRVLYSARPREAPDESNGEATQRCLEDTVRRRGLAAAVEAGPRPGCCRLRWRSSGTARASIVVCSRSPELLERCLASLESRTEYGNRELIVVEHLNEKAEELKAVVARHGATGVRYEGSFHFSRMNNLGAAASRGDVLVFLNDDTASLDPSWLERLVAQVERPDVGIAGARLLYPSGTLQHGGVAIGIGDGCAHIGRDRSRVVPHWPWLDLNRDVSAVTGACLAIRASVFREVGRFAEVFPVNYNDIDLCLRVREAGYRVIYDAGAVLRHYECQSRPGVVTAAEGALWRERWAGRMNAGDPFYSPNLTRRHEDLALGNPAGNPD